MKVLGQIQVRLFQLISAPVSITENTSIDEFLSIAEAAQRSFEVKGKESKYSRANLTIEN
jgi:hypothetical protein